MLKVERQHESEEDVHEEEVKQPATPVVVPEKREIRQIVVSDTIASGKNSASVKEEIKKEAPKEEAAGEETEKYFSQLEFKDLPLSE